MTDTSIPPIESLMDMIHKQAQTCLRKCPPSGIFDREDLVSEGILVYHQWREKFDPERGCKFITGFWWCLRNHFASYLQRAHRSSRVFATPQEKLANNVEKGYHVSEYRIGLLVYQTLTRDEHLMARELMKDPRIKRSELWKLVDVTAEKGKRILNALAYKLSEAGSLVA